jgi:Leucine-rich repeat (LRR) protein
MTISSSIDIQIEKAIEESWQGLNLRGCGLLELPPKIGKLSSLVELDLRENNKLGN